MTVPLVVIAALLIARATDDPQPASSGPPVLPAVTATAPPSSPAAESACARVIGELPLRLDGQDPRRVATDPASPFVVAWGDPAIVLRCGVPRPGQLVPGAEIYGVSGVDFLAVQGDGATTWTVIDRAVYVDVRVPASYRQPPLGPIATSIAKVLDPVCTDASTETDRSKLCTHRR